MALNIPLPPLMLPHLGLGGRDWEFGPAHNCSQLGEGVDLAINTQKAVKRLQLWPRGSGGLGGEVLGEEGTRAWSEALC